MISLAIVNHKHLIERKKIFLLAVSAFDDDEHRKKIFSRLIVHFTVIQLCFIPVQPPSHHRREMKRYKKNLKFPITRG